MIKMKRAFSFCFFYYIFQCNLFANGDDLPTCQPKDFHYEYTECDSEGGRWRVSVPKPKTCIGGAPNPPVRGKDCTFSCTPGQFLDLSDDQSCQPCPPGTYSLGGGLRFDDWERIPQAFSVTASKLSSNILALGRPKLSNANCSRSIWRPRGSYIYAMPGLCTTTLTFSTKLVIPGHVSFEYQYTDSESIFQFIVQNEQCQASEEDNSNRWPDVTEEGKWGTMIVPLKTGPNILQWRVIGALSDMVGSQSPVLIRKIEVTGVAFTSECSKCRNGTYSSGGSAFCTMCPPNTFTERGASQCQACQPDEFSEAGAAACKKRPPCTKFDYFEFQTPCDENKQTQKKYKWIEPKICSDKAEGSVSLPNSTEPSNCLPCNPGMYPVNASHCEFCVGGYSDGASSCTPCPSTTSPQYGLDYRWWTVMPPNVSSHCFSMSSSECAESTGWLPSGDFVRSMFSPSDRNSFLVLTLNIDGFKGESSSSDGKLLYLGEVKFDFELNCTKDCELVFFSDAKGRNTVVQSWTGNTKRQTYSLKVTSNGPVTYSWVFQPVASGDPVMVDNGEKGVVVSSSVLDTDGMDSTAMIYSIQATNTLTGGATHCLACPKGKTEQGCVPCPDGQYVDQSRAQCMDCPPNTVLPSGTFWGQDSCKPCGEGLKAAQRRVCRSDCHFTDKAGRPYDFTALDGVHYVQGGRLFTSTGTMYYHGFNLTLCNARNTDLPVCFNNVTGDNELLNMPVKVTGMICRSTMIPQSDSQKPLVSTQPVSLASHLSKIVSNVSLEEMYAAGGFQTGGSQYDIHFYYKSETPTLACPDGRTTIISLRCDPDEKNNDSIVLPPKCSDGTCDGCTFHFMWLTRYACPRCQTEDYDVIRGECVGGEQIIHYYPPSFCLPAGEGLKPTRQKCQVLPFAVMVAIPVALGVGVTMIVLLIYCWSKNKKLEYKYCKLVESAGGHEGDLGVESCGMEEGEEEDVHYSDNKGPKLLQKIKLKLTGFQSKDEDNPFVAVRMHEKEPLT